MLQREVIKRTLERRRAAHGDSPQFQKAAEFFDIVFATPDDCWDDLVREYRSNYTGVLEEIVQVLVETDDALIIYHTLRVLDLNDPREAEAVRKIVRDIDPDKHEVSMLGLTGEPSLRAALKQKGKLPESVRAALAPPPETGGQKGAQKGAQAEAAAEGEAGKKPPAKSPKAGRASKKAEST